MKENSHKPVVVICVCVWMGGYAQTLSVSPRGVQLHHPLQTTVFSFISNIRLIGGLLPVSADTVQKLIPNALISKHRPLPPFALVRISSTYPDIISKSELAGKLRQAHHRIHTWNQTMVVVVMLHIVCTTATEPHTV